jgi:sec-independent protein translocase protein TatB
MFEVGFTEIILILGLALLVLGPEKLPGLAQKIGRWTGRARAMARQLHAQLEHEVTLEELARSKPKSTPSAESQPVSEPPSGADFNQHVGGIDTTPEGMHGPQPVADVFDTAAPPEPSATSADIDTTPEAMHANVDQKAQS